MKHIINMQSAFLRKTKTTCAVIALLNLFYSPISHAAHSVSSTTAPLILVDQKNSDDETASAWEQTKKTFSRFWQEGKQSSQQTYDELKEDSSSLWQESKEYSSEVWQESKDKTQELLDKSEESVNSLWDKTLELFEPEQQPQPTPKIIEI